MVVPVSPQQIVEFLKSSLQYAAVVESLISQQVILQAAEERAVEVTDLELQTESNAKRSQLHLEQAADTLKWLHERGLTPEDWKSNIEAQIKLKKLREQLFKDKIENIFYQKQLEFERILLYQIIVPYSSLADELFYQIEEEEISFYEAAHLYDIDEDRRNRCGYEGILRRHDMPPDIAAVVFSGSPGVLKQPFQTELGFHLFLPEKCFQPELNLENRSRIEEQLFQDWLQREVNHFKHNRDSVTTPPVKAGRLEQ